MIPIVYGEMNLGDFIDELEMVIQKSSTSKFEVSLLRDQKKQQALVSKQIKSPFFLYHDGTHISRGYTTNNNLKEYINGIQYIANTKVIVNIAQLDRKKYQKIFEQTIKWLIIVSDFNDAEEITDLITTHQIYYDRNKSDHTPNQTKKTINFDYVEEVLYQDNQFDDLLIEKNQEFIFPYYLNYSKENPYECDELFKQDKDIDTLKLNNKRHNHHCIICGNHKSIYVHKTRNNLDSYININLNSMTAEQMCTNCKKSQRGNFQFPLPSDIDINSKKDIFYHMCKNYKWEEGIIDTRDFKFGDEVIFDAIKIEVRAIKQEHQYYCPICNHQNPIYLQGHDHGDIDKLFKGIYDSNNELIGVEINCRNNQLHPYSKNFIFKSDQTVLDAFKNGKLNELLYYVVKKIKFYNTEDFQYIKNNEISTFNIKKLLEQQ